MEVEIISKFKSKINGVEILNESIHNFIVEIMNTIEKKFKVRLNSDFVEDFYYILACFEDNDEVIHEIMYSISNAYSIQDIEIDFVELFGENFTDKINQKFKNNSYLKQQLQRS